MITIEGSNPYETGLKSDEIFLSTLRECIDWHRSRNQFYNHFLKSKNFSSEILTDIGSCSKLPFILADFFKRHVTLSIPQSEVFAHMTSSGTTGQKSQMFFDERSLRAGQTMVDSIFQHYGWDNPDMKVHYLLYSYEPTGNLSLGTSYTDNFLCKYAKPETVHYALRSNGLGQHDFDVYGCIAKLEQAARDQIPVRIFGFPSFLHATLEKMKSREMQPLHLNSSSFVFLGGGWKRASATEIPKLELYSQIQTMLGIPDLRIRDGYGSVEHSVPYIECRNHEFHIPRWSKVYIRDVRTLEVLPYKEKGFLQFVTPYMTSVPAISVLMSDLATLHPSSDCSCEIETPFFKILGRAGTTAGRSCAMQASEML